MLLRLMGDSDRVPPATRRAETVPTMPALEEVDTQSIERTDPISFPLLTRDGGTRDTERKLVTAPRTSDERATLTFLTGMDAGQVFTLPEAGCTIGRDAECEVVVDDQAVSRRHARILPLKDGFFVEDLTSTNGTFVSGSRVASTAELRPGDRIQLGPNLVLRYALVDGTEEALQRRLYESSTRDALTGAFNRAYLTERLVAEAAHARRHKAELALLMLDLDAFKRVNDEHGHLAGDAVLQSVSQLLLRLIRVEDVLARYGGEEFVVILRATNLPGAARLAERLREAVARERVDADGKGLQVTVSIGVATLAEVSSEQGATELLATADARLYRAKMSGRNRVYASDD